MQKKWCPDTLGPTSSVQIMPEGDEAGIPLF